MLKPIEYDKVDIGTISVEIKHAGKIFDGTRERRVQKVPLVPKVPYVVNCH